MFRARQFLTVLTSKLLSRVGVVLLPHLQQPILRARPYLGADFPSQRSHKTMEKTAFCAIPIRQSLMSRISAVTHLCCIASARSHLLVRKSSAANLSIVLPLIMKTFTARVYPLNSSFSTLQLGMPLEGHTVLSQKIVQDQRRKR